MQIFWHGYSSIRIEAKYGDRTVTIMTDPYENEQAIRFPRTIEPDILLLSHQDRKKFNVDGVAGKPFIISDPGEYEVKGVFVHGIQDPNAEEGQKRPLIFSIMAEDMNVAFLDQLNRKPTDYEIEALGNVDILVLPVGGGEVMDGKTAANVISMIEPRIVMPMHYHVPGIKATLGTVEQFCGAMGVCKRQDANRIKVTKKELPVEDLVVTVVERT